MPGWLQWVSDTAESIYNGAAAVYNGTVSVFSATASTFKIVGGYLTSSEFRKGFGDWLLQSWEGFSRNINPLPLISLYAHPNVSRVWRSSQAELLKRLAPKLLVRPLVSSLVQIGVIRHPLLEAVAVSALDVGATIYLLRHTASRYTNDTLNNFNMAKASADDSAPEVPKVEPGAIAPVDPNPMMHPCEHGAQSQAVAGVMSSVHYFGSLFALKLFAAYIPYGETVTLPFQMLLIGRGFTEYALAAAGNCSECRNKELNRNNPYNEAVGIAYEVSRFGGASLVKYATGAEGFMVDEIIASMLTLNFIMAANLNRKNRLPGTKPGVDYFKISRACSEVVVWKSWEWVQTQFTEKSKGDWYQELKQKILLKMQSESIKFLCRVMVDENMQDWEEFAKRPASKMFFELYGDMLLATIEYVQAERAKAAYQAINDANQWVSNKDENEFILTRFAKATVEMAISALASEDDKKMLGFLMQPELEKPLQDWHDYILKYSDKTIKVIHEVPECIDNYGADAADIAKQPLCDLNATVAVNVPVEIWKMNTPRGLNAMFPSPDLPPPVAKIAPEALVPPKANPPADVRKPDTLFAARPVPPTPESRVAGLYDAMADVNAGNASTTLSSHTFKLLKTVNK